VYLPCLDGEAEAVEEASPPGARGVGRVLLVEDDEHLRHAVARMLHREGYRVTEAASGADAVAVVESGEPLDVVLSDVVMPGLDGLATSAAIRRLLPDAKIVLMSGYTDHPALERLDGVAGLLRKPFTAAELARALREA
jgi:two-component system, cell cycle sensor histidine kinase and response regulator CckA